MAGRLIKRSLIVYFFILFFRKKITHLRKLLNLPTFVQKFVQKFKSVLKMKNKTSWQVNMDMAASTKAAKVLQNL